MSATEELLEIWEDKLKDENSKQLLQHMIVILSRYLGYPEGRAFSLYQHKGKREFLEMAKELRAVEKSLKLFPLTNKVLKGWKELRRSLISWLKTVAWKLNACKNGDIEYSQ